MNFYKTVCIVALVILVISLAFIGSAMAGSTKKMAFPPNISKCPDGYYVDYDETNDVMICKNDSATTSGCGEQTFIDASFNNPGIGPTSGACKKKRWAQNCGVDWDGLTNNPNVCYSTNI